MKIDLKYLYTILSFVIFSSFSCGGCDDNIVDQNDSDMTTLGDLGDVFPVESFEVCNSRCLDEKTDSTVAGSCKVECEEKRKANGLPTDSCTQLCTKVVTQSDSLVKRECRSLCSNDDDRDGVANAVDQCPRSEDKRVNWLGCIDSDLDGIPDKDDDCPTSKKGEKVNLKGCNFIDLCAEGNCSNTFPKCATKEECDRKLERPLSRQIPLDVRRKWITRELSKKPTPVKCAAEKSAPGQPILTIPPQGINPIEIGTVRAEFQNDKVIDGSKETLEFNWAPVVDACKPVTYAIFIESYHCHEVKGLSDPISYHNRGWCKWAPVTYESNIEETSFSYEFEVGKHMMSVHEPFETELNFNPPKDGPFTMNFQPIWLRAQVLSIDGNGTPSESGNHSDQRYYVFYNATTTTSKQLFSIPIAP